MDLDGRHKVFIVGLFMLVLVLDVVVPEAERMKQKSLFKLLPWPRFEPQTLTIDGRERYH